MNKIQLHRVIKASPAKVFRAFAQPLALASWIPPYGFLCEVHHMDFKVGGSFRISFLNFTTEKSHAFGGKYTAIDPDEYLAYTDTFDDPQLAGEMLTSIRLQAVSCGTEIYIIQSGIPVAIPVEMCYLGWQESLEKLIKLVEPDIK